MAKITRNSMIKNRIRKLRAEVKTDTQKMRQDALQNLQELFTMAKTLAQNTGMQKITDQTPPNEAQITELLQKYSFSSSL
jgi:hypothetical protein